MKYFFNRTEEAQTIDLIQSHAIDASTLEMDAFRKAATGVGSCDAS